MGTKYLQVAGWELAHMGGNCTALQRATGNGEWLITKGREASAPETLAEIVNLTLVEVGEEGHTVTYPSVAAALVAVAAAEGWAEAIINRAIHAVEALETIITPGTACAALVADLQALIGVTRG